MKFEKIAFVATDMPEARAAREEATARSGAARGEDENALLRTE